LLAGLNLFFEDRARAIREVGLAPAELLKAAAGPGDADRHADLTFIGFLKLLGDGLHDRKHGARTIDRNRLGLGDSGWG
jgi:hypothetical protein